MNDNKDEFEIKGPGESSEVKKGNEVDASTPAGYEYRPEQPPFSGEPAPSSNGTNSGWYAPGWNQPSAPPSQPQQSQWVFNDYGPVGGTAKPEKEKKPKPKREKGEKAPRDKKPGSGMKALAIVMTVLFVLSIGGFGTYIFYDLNRGALNDKGIISSQPSESKPTVDIQDTPEDSSPAPDETPLTGEKMAPGDIYSAVEPAVVGVVAYVKTAMGTQVASQGSGVVLTEDGYIVTNNHVISNEQTQKAYDKIEVILSSGDTYDASVTGKDTDTDLAVLKIEASGLKTATFGDSDKVQVGDRAFVIGNPSGVAFAGSFTGGYISAVNRHVKVQNIGPKMEYIQTDAAINPGNSGGALVNEYGQVIGITSAKLVEEAYEGMGFAIPMNNAKPIIDSLIESGWVRGRVQIGIQYIAVSETIAQLNGIPRGLRVVDFSFEGTDAEEKGVQKGDIITKIDGVEVYDEDTVSDSLKGKKPGETVKLTIYRVDSDDRAQTVELDVLLSEQAQPAENS